MANPSPSGLGGKINKVMTKKQRQEVYDKFGGRCAYCGCELGKRWHADHLECLHRDSAYDKEKDGFTLPELASIQRMIA